MGGDVAVGMPRRQLGKLGSELRQAVRKVGNELVAERRGPSPCPSAQLACPAVHGHCVRATGRIARRPAGVAQCDA
eukprot:1928504-Alexandrium_andersonii.AAC.1